MIEGILGSITNCASTREVWLPWRGVSPTYTKVRALKLKIQLQITKKGSLIITDFYFKIKVIADNLIASSYLVADEDVILHILSSLGT